jgi:hypothetical protein
MARVPLAVLAALPLLLLGLLSCSTTSGSLAKETAKSDVQQAEVQVPEPVIEGDGNISPGEPGLQVDSRPDDATVLLDNRYAGLTPVLITDLTVGGHRLTVTKPGYYPYVAFIRYNGGHVVIDVALQQVTGFLKVDVSPAQAEVRVDGVPVDAAEVQQLPVGTHSVTVQAFGYQEYRTSVQIDPRQLTVLDVSLTQAEFGVSPLRPNREAFNPRNAGLLGTVSFAFRVTSFGDGKASITDQQGREVYQEELAPFTTFDQSFLWSGRTSAGSVLPDGLYTAKLVATGEREGKVIERQATVRIDSAITIAIRSLWSGSAGLLYAPVPGVLPGGSVQFAGLFLAHSSGDGEQVIRVPWDLGLRLGLGRHNRIELDLLGGGIPGYYADAGGSGFSMPFFAAAAVKGTLFEPSGSIGLGSAFQAKLAYQYHITTDTLADFTGFSVGLPTALRLGPLALLLSPEVVISPLRVYYGSGPAPEPGFYSWAYARAGLLLDASPFSFGLSASLRSLPFNEGFGLDLPVQAALEAHLLIPGTVLYLSLALAGEFSGPTNYYLMGGGGLGIIH